MAEKTFKEWLDAHHTGIANAIRTKEGSTEKIEPEDFEQRILDLPSGGEVVNAQEKEVKLEYINQSFFPDSGYNYLSKLKINSILTSLETFTEDKFASIIKQGESILGIEGNYTGIDGISLDTSSVNVDFFKLPKSYLDIANLVPNSNKYVRFDNSNGDVNISYAGKNANIDFTGATGTISLENTGSLVFSGGGLDASKIADGETILGVPGNFKGEGTTVVESIPGVKVGTASIDIDFAETSEGIVNANIYEATATSQIKVNGSEYDLVANISQGQVGINGVNTTYSIYDTGESSYVDVASKSPTIDLSGSTGTITINEISPEKINSEKYIIENLNPENIANGVWILGKQGTFKGTSFVTQDKEVESITHLPFTIYPDVATGGSLPNVLTSVTIRGVSPSIDPYIKEENIIEGVTILGIEGKAIVPEGNIDIVANTPTEIPLDVSRYATATVRVPQEGEILKEQRFDGNIDKLPFTLVPDNGFKLTEVIVRGVEEGVDNLEGGNIRKGVTVLGVPGEYEDPLTETTLNIIPTTMSQTINPSNDYDYIKVKNIVVQPVTASIDAEIIASNIKRGVNILGVDGEFDGIPIEFVNGTPIDPSDTITTIYFNQNISVSGMNNIFSQLDYIDNIYRVAESEDMSSHIWIVRTASGDSYNYEIQLLDNTVNGIVGETYTFNGFQSVSSLTIINQTIPVGQQNDLLETIISTTPFTLEGIKQELETIEVTASKNTDITVSAATQGYDSDKYTLSKVVVRKVTANVDSNIQAKNIAKDVYILGVKGELESVEGVKIEEGKLFVDGTYTPQSIYFDNCNQSLMIFENTCRDLAIYYDGQDGTFDFSKATGTITLVGDSSNTDVNFVFDGINGGLEGVTGSDTTLTITDSSLWTKVALNEPEKSISILGNKVTVDLLDANSVIINTLPTSGIISFGSDISRTQILDAASINTYTSTNHTITSSDGITLETAGMYCPNNIIVNVDSSLLNGTPGVTVEGSSITVDSSYNTINLNEDANATYNVAARYGTMNLTLQNTSLNITPTKENNSRKLNKRMKD